jgi:hypothetical protein
MKSRWIAGLLAVTLVVAAPNAFARGLGIGAYGGVSIPVLQDDVEQGTTYGVRAPLHLLPTLTFEPFYESTGLGDVDEDFGGLPYTRSGGDMSRFGLNVLFEFGTGVTFYPYGGFSSHKWTRDGSPDFDEVGYNGGLGIGFGTGIGLRFDLRGELDVIPTDDTSRKFGNVNVGVSYNLFKMP